jgi:hypothetical protein
MLRWEVSSPYTGLWLISICFVCEVHLFYLFLSSLGCSSFKMVLAISNILSDDSLFGPEWLSAIYQGWKYGGLHRKCRWLELTALVWICV